QEVDRGRSKEETRCDYPLNRTWLGIAPTPLTKLERAPLCAFHDESEAPAVTFGATVVEPGEAALQTWGGRDLGQCRLALEGDGCFGYGESFSQPWLRGATYCR
ncbi:MAG: hypothetical protein AAFQ53_17760, partial [Bacteroidota bacterium]